MSHLIPLRLGVLIFKMRIKISTMGWLQRLDDNMLSAVLGTKIFCRHSVFPYLWILLLDEIYL